jgi:hypothetical protein
MLRALLLVSSMAALLGACVVPIAPEWSDPESNRPPAIVSAKPPIGTTLGINNVAVEAEATLSDQNTGDNLYFRWIIDYPPDGQDTIRALEDRKPGGGSLVRTPVRFAPSCSADRLSTTASNHRLTMVASDRPFDGDFHDLTKEPDAVAAGNYLVRADWPFVLSCQ